MGANDPFQAPYSKLPPIPYAQPDPWAPAGKTAYAPPMVYPVTVTSLMPPRNGLAVASLACGISALALMWVPYVSIVCLPTGVVGIILGGVGIARAGQRYGQGKGMAIAGLIVSSLSVLIFIGLIVFVIILIQQAMSYYAR